MYKYSCPNCKNTMDGHIQKCAFCQWNRGDPQKHIRRMAFPKAQHWALLVVLYAIGCYLLGANLSALL